MYGAILPLRNTPSWRGAQLKQKDNFTFTFVTVIGNIYWVLPIVGGIFHAHDVSGVASAPVFRWYIFSLF
jgi:hypothetical protein